MSKKRNVWMKLLAGFLVCVGCFFIIAAGNRDSSSGAVSNSAANVNAPGVYPICKTPITINVAIRQHPNVEDYETNLQTKLFEERGNFKLQFEYYPAGTPGMERIQVVIASGGVLPEALISFAFNDVQLLLHGEEGIFLNLDDYYENWAYEFPRQFQKVSLPQVWQWMHSANGHVYYVPYIQETIGENYALRGWINQTWLDNLGLSTPETTEEFRSVLEAFRDRDPKRNGRRDIIPAAGSLEERGRIADFLINAFIYNDGRDRLIVENGRVDVIYNKPDYREALRYINGLMNDGLIYDRIFTMDLNALRAINESESTASIGFFTAGFAGAFAPRNTMRLDYVPISPLMGPKGVQYTPFYPLVPIVGLVITKDARNPEAIFRWGDYMCGEEASIWSRYGVPEIDWRRPLPGEKSLYDDMGFPPVLAQILPWGSIQNSHWVAGSGGPGILPLGLTDGMIPSDNPLDNPIWVAKSVPLHIGKIPPVENRVEKTIFTYQEMMEISDIQNAINTYVNENLALFVTGQRSIERDWDAYVREFERLNLRRYLQIMQSGYERAIGR